MQNVLHKASFLSFSNCRFYIRTSCHAMGRVYDNFGKQWTLWGGLQNFRSWLMMYEGDYGQTDFILLLRPIRLMLRPALRNLQLCIQVSIYNYGSKYHSFYGFTLACYQGMFYALQSHTKYLQPYYSHFTVNN